MSDIETARALEGSGEFVDALRIYRSLYAQNPSDEAAILGLAQCALALNRPEVAFEFYFKLLIVNHENPWGYLGRAHVMFMYGQTEKALVDLRRAVSLDEPGSELRIDCAALVNDYGYPGEAKEILAPVRASLGDSDDFICEWLYALLATGELSHPDVERMMSEIRERWQGDLYVDFCQAIFDLKNGDTQAIKRIYGILEEAPEFEGKAEFVLNVG